MGLKMYKEALCILKESYGNFIGLDVNNKLIDGVSIEVESIGQLNVRPRWRVQFTRLAMTQQYCKTSKLWPTVANAAVRTTLLLLLRSWLAGWKLHPPTRPYVYQSVGFIASRVNCTRHRGLGACSAATSSQLQLTIH